MANKITENNMVVDIALVKPNKYNPKLDYNSTPELQAEYERIKNSLKSHGQIAPVIVREIKGGYEIVDGFHRYCAVRDLGYDKVEVKNLGKIPLKEAIAKTLSLDRPHILADAIMEAELIKQYKELEGNLADLPFTLDEIDKKIEMLGFNFDQYNQQNPEGEENPQLVVCPECGHEFTI